MVVVVENKKATGEGGSEDDMQGRPAVDKYSHQFLLAFTLLLGCFTIWSNKMCSF